MECFYQRTLALGGVSGNLTGARRAALLKAHERYHAKCRPFRQADVDQFLGMFLFPGDDAFVSAAARGAARQARLKALRARGPCRACGAIDCVKPECFRSILIRQRLDEHATAAERDA